MRIVTVYQTDPLEAGQGGGARFVRNLLVEQRKAAEEVLFLGVGDKRVQDGNLTLVPISNHVGSYIPFLIKLCMRLLFTNLSRFDVVHVHRLYFALPFLLLKPGLKIVSTQHGRTFAVFGDRYGLFMRKLVLPVLMFIERFCLKRVDYLVFVSRDVENTFKEKHPALMAHRADYNQAIGSMLDFSAFEAKPHDFLASRYGHENQYLLFLGRLSAVKDIDFLLQVFSEKFQNRSQVKLVIVGAGEDEQKVHEQAARLCPANAPILHGAVSAEDVPALMQSANVLILCSHHEGSPTVVAEALASGTPVVTSQVGDVDEYITNGVNGFIADKTTSAFAHAIEQLLVAKHAPGAIYEASAANLDKRSANHIGQSYMAIYHQVAAHA